MSELSNDLRESLEEVREIMEGKRHAARTTAYKGYIRVEVRENGETVWTLREASKELRRTNLSQYRSPGELLQAVRKTLGQSQSGMAEILGISKATYQNWEHDRVRPQGPAVSLIKMVIENPVALMKASRSQRELNAI